ncbi:hypothetical protein Tco_0661204, partial [Tanacetum coccineum]
MSTQQDIYAAGSENCPPILNKDNYIPWSSRLIRYAKSKPNGKLIYNSIMHGPYVRRMIPEPGDPDCEVPVAETFHEQTDDEPTNKELKQMEADDQAIQTILMGLPEDIYVAVDSCETAQEIWLRVQQMMKGSDIGVEVNKLRVERLARTHDPLALMANSNNPYNYPVFHQDQPPQVTYMQQLQPNNNYIPQSSFNSNYMQQPMPNPEDILDPTTAMNMILVLMAKTFKLNYSTPTNNNQRILSNPRNRQIAQPVQNVENQVVQNAVQNLGVQNVRNQNGLIIVSGIANQNGNGNVVAARAEGNGNVNNGNQIRCYNYKGIGHLARNCTVRPRRRNVAYLQTQLLIAQKGEAMIQLQAEEFNLMDAEGDLDEIDEMDQLSAEQSGGTVEQHAATVEET